MGCKWSFATVAEKLGLLTWGGRPLMCSAQEPHPCLGLNLGTPCTWEDPWGTLYSWTEKGVGVASLLLSHFCALWHTLQPGRGFTAPPSSSKPSS